MPETFAPGPFRVGMPGDSVVEALEIFAKKTVEFFDRGSEGRPLLRIRLHEKDRQELAPGFECVPDSLNIGRAHLGIDGTKTGVFDHPVESIFHNGWQGKQIPTQVFFTRFPDFHPCLINGSGGNIESSHIGTLSGQEANVVPDSASRNEHVSGNRMIFQEGF